MKIGDWAIDDAGRIKHLKCDVPASWATDHRCWKGNGRILMTGHEQGKYTLIKAPQFVRLISTIRYDIWQRVGV